MTTGDVTPLPGRAGRTDEAGGADGADGADTARRARPARTWPAVLAAVVLVTAGVAAVWYLAAPRAGICPAIHPAPPGCATADRVGPGIAATAGLVVALAVAVLLLRTVARGRPGRTAVVLTVLGLLAVTLANVVRLA